MIKSQTGTCILGGGNLKLKVQSANIFVYIFFLQILTGNKNSVIVTKRSVEISTKVSMLNS